MWDLRQLLLKNIFSVSADTFTSSFSVIESSPHIFKAGILVVLFVGCLVALHVSCMLLEFRFWRFWCQLKLIVYDCIYFSYYSVFTGAPGDVLCPLLLGSILRSWIRKLVEVSSPKWYWLCYNKDDCVSEASNWIVSLFGCDINRQHTDISIADYAGPEIVPICFCERPYLSVRVVGLRHGLSTYQVRDLSERRTQEF